MKRNTKLILLLIIVVLVPVFVKLQSSIDPLRAQFQPGKGVGSVMTNVGNNPVILPSQYIAGTLIGFREVIAGLLWVRTDEFFHNGNFDAIVPLIRMITWLDPHQVDVYSTGSWHLSYNFTDSAERADRRYLAPAIKFLEEGIENNPNVWDLKFSAGFTIHALKTLDYKKALFWEKLATKDDGCLLYVYRQIANSYAKDGRIDEAIQQWRDCIKQGDEELKKNPEDRNAFTHKQVAMRNLDDMLIRKTERADLPNRPTKIVIDVRIWKIAPKVLMVAGKSNLPDGARIDFSLKDFDYVDYDKQNMKAFSWEVDPTVTGCFMTGMHGLLVTKGKFSTKLNLSKDPKIYSFTKDKYVATFSFNPRRASANVQDVVGWNGEGISDDTKYLDKSIPGLKQIKKEIILTKSDII